MSIPSPVLFRISLAVTCSPTKASEHVLAEPTQDVSAQCDSPHYTMAILARVDSDRNTRRGERKSGPQRCCPALSSRGTERCSTSRLMLRRVPRISAAPEATNFHTRSGVHQVLETGSLARQRGGPRTGLRIDLLLQETIERSRGMGCIHESRGSPNRATVDLPDARLWRAHTGRQPIAPYGQGVPTPRSAAAACCSRARSSC